MSEPTEVTRRKIAAAGRTTLTFKYLLLSNKTQHESNDVESVLETARVMLLHGHDVSITLRKEEG